MKAQNPQAARIFISTIPFGEVEPSALELLDKSGFEYSINPLGRKLKADEVAEIAKDYDALIAGTEDTIPLIQSSKKLQIISRVGIGLDSVPLELCKKKESLFVILLMQLQKQLQSLL